MPDSSSFAFALGVESSSYVVAVDDELLLSCLEKEGAISSPVELCVVPMSWFESARCDNHSPAKRKTFVPVKVAKRKVLRASTRIHDIVRMMQEAPSKRYFATPVLGLLQQSLINVIRIHPSADSQSVDRLRLRTPKIQKSKSRIVSSK